MERLRDNQIKVGIYCRLSVDDGIAASDSVSIQNQRAIITDFVNKKGWHIENYYIDDGYSGTNFDRPGFKEMIHDIESRKINTVITKDLSRLGRNYIKTGYYIDTYFPDRNIRYIAISDNIDTYERDDDFLPFKNIFNEMYAKDISKKIRFTIDNQMKNGKPIKTSNPLYGYQFDDKSNRIPNPDTAPIVKLIYDLFLEGNGFAQIARILKEKEVITPLYYNYQKYGYGSGTNKIFDHDIYTWSRKTIREILMNDEYLGIYRRGKTRGRFKSKKKEVVAKDDQYVFFDKYEPLITKDVYETAQEQIGIFKRRGENGVYNRYSGIAFCAICNRPLMHKKDIRKDTKDFIRLTCRTPGCGPTRGTILYEDLDKIMKNEIMKLKSTILKHKDEFLKLAKKMSSNNQVYDEKRILLEERAHCEDTISKLEHYIRKAYEQKVDNIIPDSVYQPLINKYTQEKNDLLSRIKSINTKIDEQNETNPDFVNDSEEFIKRIEGINQINCVEAVNLKTLISRIYISTDGKKKRREKMNKSITIVYRKINGLIKEFLDE